MIAKSKIEYGDQCKDQITGFKGVATAIAGYMTGCTQILIAPPLRKDGTFVEGRWFDVDRVIPVGGKPVRIKKISTPGFGQPAPVR